MTESYVSIRDDSGIRSLSTNERDFLRSCAHGSKTLRVDGRRGHELRKVRLQLGRWDNGAECTVQWGGGTRVTSLCSAELVPPSPDRPNEGMVNFIVDFSPMAGSSFRQAPAISTAPSLSSSSRGPNYSDQSQRLLSNRILRSVERIILLGGALDTEALVLAPGKWVWRFTIALTVLDDGGNIIDASIMAAIAALRHYRKPQVDFSYDDEGETSSGTIQLPTMIPSIVKEAIPLPLHHTPLSISFSLIPADGPSSNGSSTSIVTALVDPTDREELVQDGNLTIAMNMHSEVCLLDYGGGCEIPPAKLKECWKIAETSIKELCHLLEETLKEADEKAQRERLERLQQQQSGNVEVPVPLPPANVPYFEQTHDTNEMEVQVDVNSDQIAQAQTKAEEAYRQQALDYSQGHVASKVRENKSDNRSSAQQKAASLLAAMLKSASQMEVAGDDAVTPPAAPSSEEKMTDMDLHMPTSTATKEELTNHDFTSNERQPVAMDLDDDDEEEAPTILQSEFQPTPAASSEKTEETKETETPATTGLQEDDMVDLSMAVKKKKKKSKKKK